MAYDPIDVTVPIQDSTDNIIERDVIGSKTDTAAGNSLVSLEKINAASIAATNTNIGDPSGDSLTSITAKLGNDTAAVKARFDTIDSNTAVPSANVTDNIKMRDVVGNKEDSLATSGNPDVHQGSISGRTADIWEHQHSQSMVYPTLADGILVVGGLTSWLLGAFSVVVPADTITKPFDIHCLNVSAYNASDTFELVLYSGPDDSEAEVGRVRFTRLTNVGAAPHEPFMTPIIPANSQIKAKIASQLGTSNTATISIMYHEYGDDES